MKERTALISGASIAGTSLAYWLHHFGYRVTVVERAPSLRPGGQAVDFKGATHRRVLTEMGVLEEVERRQTGKTDLQIVDDRGRVQATMPGEFIGGDIEILRGDLAELLYDKTSAACEYLFDDTIVGLNDTGDAVEVSFEKEAPRTSDLVLGADGIHSRVRRLAFGPERDYVRFLGYYYAVVGLQQSTDPSEQLSGRAVGQMFNRPGKLAVLGGSKAPALFVFASDELADSRGDVEGQKALLAATFADAGWKVPEMLAGLSDADDFFFDSLSRVRMDTYTTGRVALVGDSAYGNTLGGFGTGLAMVGAYVLAHELAVADHDHQAAFRGYNERMHRYAKIARTGNAGPFLAPPNPLRIRMRNWTFKSRLLFGLMMKLTDLFANDVELPEQSYRDAKIK